MTSPTCIRILIVGVSLFALSARVAAQTPQAANTEQESPSGEGLPTTGSPLGGETQSSVPLSSNPPPQVPENPEDVDPNEIVEEFKRLAPDDATRQAGLASLAAFDEKVQEFAQAMILMRRYHTEYLNEINKDSERYRIQRNEARKLMNETYDKALDVVRFMPHPVAARYVVTIIDHRVNQDIYDMGTLEGAARLLDYGIRFRYLAHAAARAGMCVGDFKLANRIYDRMGDDELEDIDRMLNGGKDAIEKQFEVEKELLEKDPDDLPKVKFTTTKGEFVAELYIHEAPSTVAHFINLVQQGFYSESDFYNVLPGDKGGLAMTGDPAGDGTSRPDKYIVDEHQREVIRMPLRGSLAMAKLPIPGTPNFVPNSGGTQFAILFIPIPGLVEQQTVFGRVIEGMEVLGELRRVDPSEKKEKKVNVPPDRIIECELINVPDQLPEIQYVDPSELNLLN